eukprot:TRINITY_DN609_c0_g1_i2.p1 TRINITY_DN609_c0_g1~~TRINITY_DN609_c0_g1_i2.p1  ORF type:complete len:315 (+),score=39.46 TRINITY_DN609_c0_g1_i2:147-1091(+)
MQRRAVHSPYYGFFVACMYGIISISITFANKAVFHTWEFGSSNFLTLGQIIFSLVVMALLKQQRMIDYPNFDPIIARKMVPLGVAFASMVFTGLAALKWINIPMYGAIRRLTTFIVIVWQYILLKKTVPTDEFASVVVMILGATVAGGGDLDASVWGYLLTIANCVTTAWYLVLINKTTEDTGLQTFGLMFYNNILSMPIMVIAVLLTEIPQLMEYPHWLNPGFIFTFILSSSLAIVLNYFVFLCSTVNSPLTTSVTGQLKSIVPTVLGLFLFGGVPLTWLLISGLSLSTFAGFWYGYIKYSQQQRALPKTSNV